MLNRIMKVNSPVVFLFTFIVFSTSCNQNTKNSQTEEHKVALENLSLYFDNKPFPEHLVHRGIIGPDYQEYYFTISDRNFSHFDVWVLKREKESWSEPTPAFFNSEYNDHGMSFSADGRSLYFSSTRPVDAEGVAQTWHLWKSESRNGKWTKPEFVDIPNLRSKLVSHPTVTKTGTLYFHSSNLDYSEMQLYRSALSGDHFGPASLVDIPSGEEENRCTPYISKEEDYMIYAKVGKQLDLMISYRDSDGEWSSPLPLSEEINSHGQGNPYVSSDEEYLFYASGIANGKDWKVNRVAFDSIR